MDESIKTSSERLVSFRRSALMLELIFDIVPTMSERMELRNYVFSAVEDMSRLKHLSPNKQDPIKIGVVRFLMINYPSANQSLISRSVTNGYPINSLNQEIRELRNRYD